MRLTVTDRERLRPVSLGIEIAVALRDLHPADWDRSKLGVLLANRTALELLENGATADRIAASWQGALRAFEMRSRKYFLY